MTSALIIASCILFLIIGVELFFLNSINHALGEKNATANPPSPTTASIVHKPIIGKKLPPPEMAIDTTKKYEALIKTTVGPVQVELFADKAPITVNNFIYLARSNFYQNIEFHRVVKNLFIQTGDPTGTGGGGPGYQFADEITEAPYIRGTVAMANGKPNTNGSQFFIVTKNNTVLKGYTTFGRVIEGMEIVDMIASASMQMDNTSLPIKPEKIVSVEITEK